MTHLRRLPSAVIAASIALVVYSLAAGGMLTEQSLAPHFVLLADAFRHGRLEIANTGNLFDLLVKDGHLYVSSPPMAGVLLLPVVALFSATFSDVLYSVVLGSISVGLVQHIFQRRWLTLFFAAGTSALLFSTMGTMWFQAQQVAILFTLLAVWAARDHRWLVAGIMWGAAILSRPTLAFGLPFLLGWAWTEAERSRRARVLAAVLAPMVVAGGLYGWYNAARFGSPLNFGYEYLAASENIQKTLAAYGTFHPRFVPCNLWVALFQPPEINGYVPPIVYRFCGYLLSGVNLADSSTWIVPNPLGMSLMLTSPAFLLLLWARGRHPLIIAAWLGTAGTMVPTMLLHNTGSLQFGFRYWMDASAMWLLLMASVMPTVGSGSRWPVISKAAPRWLAKTLIILSLAMHLWGFFWLYQKLVGMTWWVALSAR